ncbi:hypothetical protein FKM82_014133 [Ascaphus truei]
MKQRLMIGKKQIITLKGNGSTIKDCTYHTELRASTLSYIQTQITQHNPTEEEQEEITDDVPCGRPEAAAIESMKSGKAPRVDGIKTEILEEVDKILAKLLTCCMKNNNIPEHWSNAIVMLINKKGDKEGFKNYRPIRLLLIICTFCMDPR